MSYKQSSAQSKGIFYVQRIYASSQKLIRRKKGTYMTAFKFTRLFWFDESKREGGERENLVIDLILQKMNQGYKVC